MIKDVQTITNIIDKLDRVKETTELPDKPDFKKINEFVASVNERIVKNEI